MKPFQKVLTTSLWVLMVLITFLLIRCFRFLNVAF